MSKKLIRHMVEYSDDDSEITVCGKEATNVKITLFSKFVTCSKCLEAFVK